VLNDGSSPGRDANVFHAVWTDNRDATMTGALPEPPSDGTEGPAVGYAAPATPACGSDPMALPTARNANVYTSRITPGLFVAAPGNAKPTTGCATCAGGMIQRAFGVFVQNSTGQTRKFRLRIENQPPDSPAGFARFDQLAVGPPSTAFEDIHVTIGPRSSAARSVYVTSGEKYPYILVTVLEQDAPSGQVPLAGSAILNPDIQNPDIQNPDIQNPDIQNTEIHNPDIQNPDIQNPDIQNPDIQNPDIQNPDIQNPDIQNPDIQNPDIQNGSLTDVSFDVTNDGNTTSTYQVGVGVDGVTSPYLFQLIGRRVYRTPTARDCLLVEAATNQILFNVPNPTLDGSLFDPGFDDVRNATILLEPGETIKITLRVWDRDVLTGTGAPPDDGIQPFCPLIGDLCTTVTHNVTLVVEAHAFNNVDGVIDVEGGRPSAGEPASPFAITSDLPPGAIVGIPYGPVAQQTSGGTPPFTWTLSAGSLPAGITLDPSTGALSGTPTAAGVSNFTLRVQDSAEPALTAIRPFTIQTLAIGPGDILVSDGTPGATSGSVFSITPDGATTTLVATIPGRAQDIAVDAQRRLIIVDSTNATIRRVTPGRVETIYSGAPLMNPVAVAVAAGGEIIVGDNVADRIYRIAPDGSTIVELASLVESTEAQDIQITPHPAGGVVVTDDEGTTVSVFRITWDGAETFVDDLLIDSTEILRAGGVAVTSAGNILIADFAQNTIFTVEPVEGAIVQSLSLPSIGSNMVGLAIDSAGNYIVPINFEAAVKKVTFQPEGAPVISTIKSGAPLTFPTSVVLIPAPPVILLIDGPVPILERH
jgi:sugar lactone lactonase YvrE